MLKAKKKEETIQGYQEQIQEFFSSKSETVFSNSGPEHASVVISNIFDNSKNQIRIYGINMDGTISKKGNYISSLFGAAVRSVKMDVVLDQTPSNDSYAYGFFKALSKISPNQVRLKRSNDEFKKIINSMYTIDGMKELHFCTGDDHMFRLETDPDTHTAICCANNETHTAQINAIFDRLFNSLEDLN